MRARRLPVAVFTVALTAALTGCGGGGAGSGFGARQLAGFRDPSVDLDPQNLGAVLVVDEHLYFTTTSMTSGQSTWWSLDLGSGQLVGLGPMPMIPTSPIGGGGRYQCHYGSSADGVTVEVRDTATGATTLIDGALWGQCPSAEHQDVVVWRSDGMGALQLFAGPFDQLQPVALDVTVGSIIGYSDDGSVATVVAARTDSPGAWALMRIARATFETTTLVTAALAPTAAWAPGATATSAPLASATLLGQPRAGVPWVPVKAIGDHYTYARELDGGGVAVFAGPFPSEPAGELALFIADGDQEEISAYTVADPESVATGRPFGRVGLRTWQTPVGPSGAATGSLLRTWSATARRLVSCPLTGLVAGLSGAIAPSGTRVLLSDKIYGDGSGFSGPMLLVSADAAAAGDDAGACRLFAAAGASNGLMSIGGGTLLWLVDAAAGARELWTAAGDGTGVRRLIAGDVKAVGFVGGATTVELTLAGDLGWLDPADADPVAMHYVAEKVFGQRAKIRSKVVTGYDFREQDGTGTLGIADWQTGAKRPIASAVAAHVLMEPAAPAAPSDPDPVVARAVYLVRGRSPSSIDGFWLASLRASDLP